MVVDITAKLHTSTDAPDFIGKLNLEQSRLKKRHASTRRKSVDYTRLPPKKKMCLDYVGESEADSMSDTTADVFSTEEDEVVIVDDVIQVDTQNYQKLPEKHDDVAEETKQTHMWVPGSRGTTSDGEDQAARDKIFGDHLLKDKANFCNVRTVVVPVYIPVPIVDVPERRGIIAESQINIPERQRGVNGSQQWWNTEDSPLQQGMAEPRSRAVPNRPNPDAPAHNTVLMNPSPDVRAPMYRFTAGRSHPEIQSPMYGKIHNTKRTYKAPLYCAAQTAMNHGVPIAAYQCTRGIIRKISRPDRPLPFSRQRMPPPVCCPPPRRSRSFSERAQPLYTFVPQDPREWTKSQVHQWLQELSRKYGIQRATPDRFPMNGKGVNMMNLTMFLDRVPRGGHILFNDFSRRVSNALAHGTTVRAASA